MSRCDLSSDIRGGFSRGVPPLPIPNRAVKPARADGTDTPVGRVGRRRASGSPGRLMTSGAPLCMLVPVPFPAPGPDSSPAPPPVRPRPRPRSRPRARACPFAFSCPRSCPRSSPRPDSGPAPPPVRPPYSDLPVRFPCPALPGDGNGRKCRPSVRRGTVGRRKRGRSVPRACAAAPLGDGIGRKCRPGVRRGAVRRRNGAEMSPERVVMPRWATDWGRSVPRACGAAPLGYGNGRKCRPSVWSVPCV